jgi:hypothetical protein
MFGIVATVIFYVIHLYLYNHWLLFYHYFFTYGTHCWLSINNFLVNLHNQLQCQEQIRIKQDFRLRLIQTQQTFTLIHGSHNKSNKFAKIMEIILTIET